MPLTASETVAFYGEQAARSGKGIAVALERNDFFLAQLNYNGLLNERLMQGLIQWRHQLGDPSVPFSLAIDELSNAYSVLERLGGGQYPIWEGFHFHDLELIEFLVGRECSSEIADEVIQGWNGKPRDFADTMLSMALLHALCTGDLSPRWNELMSAASGNKRMKLLAETFQEYGRIITCAARGDGPAAIDAVEHCGELFKKRKRDSYYSGGTSVFGGGLDNNFVVDYPLAALVKRFVPKEALFRLSSDAAIHLWRWA